MRDDVENIGKDIEKSFTGTPEPTPAASRSAGRATADAPRRARAETAAAADVRRAGAACDAAPLICKASGDAACAGSRRPPNRPRTPAPDNTERTG